MSLASRRRRHLIKTCASCVAAGDLRPPFMTSCTLAAGENLTMTGASEVIHHEVAVTKLLMEERVHCTPS
jgi:hypothetical protein